MGGVFAALKSARVAATALALALCAPALAAGGGGGGALPAAPIDRADYSSLQRGAALFVNYCLGCHGMQYVRYGRLQEDLKIPRELLRERLMPPGAGVADVMRSAMPSQHAGEWLLQAPPDLSLSARLRGADWLYAYLRGFYRDESAPAGWNNAIFEGVAMPHALASLQGERRLEDGELRPPVGGRLSAAEYDLLVADLVNFMDYAADPARPQRHRAGYLFISVLLVLFMLAYFVYRDYWREIR